MSERPPRSEHYKRTREEFDELEIEDKAVFLLEATVATFARGVETFGRALADQIDRAFTAARNPRSPGTEEEAPPPETGAGPAEPGSPAGASPKSGSAESGSPAGASPKSGSAASPKTQPGRTPDVGQDEESLL
jgi:hypothetical protein